MKNMSDYHNLCHYFCSPGLSGDAMIKMTGVKLRNDREEDFLPLLRDNLKQIINT